MSKDYKQLREELSSGDYTFFCNEMKEELRPFEHIRLRYLDITTKIMQNGCLLSLFMGLLFFISCIIRNYGLYIVSVLVFLLGCSLVLLAVFLRKQYCTKVKRVLLPKILSYMGDFKVEKVHTEIKKYIKKSSMLKGYYGTNIKVDDYIVGKYQGLPFEVVEFSVDESFLYGFFSKKDSNLFTGLLIRFKSPLPIDISKLDKKMKNIKRFLRLYSNPKYRICLKQNIFDEKGYINICIPEGIDWFEVDIKKSINDETNYKNILQEFIDIFAIVDDIMMAIKNQNIINVLKQYHQIKSNEEGNY